MPKEMISKSRRITAQAGLLMFAALLALWSMISTRWVYDHPSLVHSIMAGLLFGSIACFTFWLTTNDSTKSSDLRTVGKMQKARDVNGKMFQAEVINYQETSQKVGLPDLELEIKEIVFNATKTGGLSAFVWIKGLLKQPKQLNTTYSLALVMHGISMHFEIVQDLDEWRFRSKESIDSFHGTGQFHYPQPMPSSLEAGVYAEGWLHFVSQETHDPLTLECTVRLRVDTPAGKLERERHGITFKGTGYQMSRKEFLEVISNNSKL